MLQALQDTVNQILTVGYHNGSDSLFHMSCHVMACLSVVIQALCLQPNLLHNWCFISLEKLPGIGSLPGSMVLPVMHIGRVQEDIGLRGTSSFGKWR